ncbi:hypothetical protein [Aliarcobacter trophiarum]|uniref:hypothetical protein n=1 Tax=Aliarcobacter trophiarum TaxID=708186 RepID=UPI00100C110C|nr:hypothetical protein [Aliarcobacter trophiarum]RXI27652.1 hypothetical protein CRU89_05080 [Aliarcobacter trophiarum]
MDKITFKISSEELIEDLQDDCRELVQSYSEQFENTHQIDDVVEEIIEGISLMLLDNANSLERYLDDRANRK